MSVQDHVRDAKRDARVDMADLIHVAALGQQALAAIGAAQTGKAQDLLAIMLASFREYEANRALRAAARASAPLAQGCSIAERGRERGFGAMLGEARNGG